MKPVTDTQSPSNGCNTHFAGRDCNEKGYLQINVYKSYKRLQMSLLSLYNPDAVL